jgi:DNA-binding NtrC family response regulator
MERVMIREPYRKIFVSSAAAAMKRIETTPIAVVVSDLKMPGMDGLTFLRKIRETNPSIIRIVLSGFTQISQVLAAVNRGEIFRFLTKPVDEQETFRATIRQALSEFEIQNNRAHLLSRLTLLTQGLSALSGTLHLRLESDPEGLLLLTELDTITTELQHLALRKSLENTR